MKKNQSNRTPKVDFRSAVRLSVATCALVAIATACSSARFGGNQGAASKNDSGSGTPGAATAPLGTPGSADSPGTSTSAIPGSTATPTGPAACTTDQVKLDWSGDEKACIDKGQTWAFDTGKCMDIRKAAFDCTWSNAIAELDKKGLTTQLCCWSQARQLRPVPGWQPHRYTMDQSRRWRRSSRLHRRCLTASASHHNWMLHLLRQRCRARCCHHAGGKRRSSLCLLVEHLTNP